MRRGPANRAPSMEEPRPPNGAPPPAGRVRGHSRVVRILPPARSPHSRVAAVTVKDKPLTAGLVGRCARERLAERTRRERSAL